VEAQRRRAGVRLVAVLLGTGCLLSGCGSVSTTTVTRSTPQPPPPTGNRTFAERGFAIHFTYPAAFVAARLSSVSRRLDRGRHVTRAALGVGSGRYDLLIVSRHPRIRPPITERNIGREKPIYDRTISRLFGHRMTGRVARVGGLPALSYPTVPTPGVRGASTRATFVFVGHDEYELQCQWTSVERAAVTAACKQMLRSLRT
jgi:hypothetical protein